MSELVVELPFPPRVLHPNSAVLWRAKIKPKREFRENSRVATLAEMQKRIDIEGGLTGLPAKRATITPIFTFTVKRNRDSDNSLAWLKSGLDGVADAMMMDDHRFIYMPVEFVYGKEKRLHLRIEW